MMTNDFASWLMQNGLTEEFTTSAGDAFYTNRNKGFGVLKKANEYGAHSFYLDDIIAFRTMDDENLVAEWNAASGWRLCERCTRYSTNEVYLQLYFKNRPSVKLQIFRATGGNISRSDYNHVNLLNYACQISQIILFCATGQ